MFDEVEFPNEAIVQCDFTQEQRNSLKKCAQEIRPVLRHPSGEELWRYDP